VVEKGDRETLSVLDGCGDKLRYCNLRYIEIGYNSILICKEAKASKQQLTLRRP